MSVNKLLTFINTEVHIQEVQTHETVRLSVSSESSYCYTTVTIKRFQMPYTEHTSSFQFNVWICLWAGGFVGWVQYVSKWTVIPKFWGDCRLYKFLFFFCEHYSSALIVIMSIEKFFALYLPLKTRSVCTVSTARWVLLGAALIFIIFNTQAFFIYKAQTNSNGRMSVSFLQSLPLSIQAEYKPASAWWSPCSCESLLFLCNVATR